MLAKKSTVVMSVSGIALAAGMVTAGTATAAENVRLDGMWDVTQTIVKHTTNPKDVGRRIKAKFRFTPKCDTGGCTTVLKFNNGERNVKVTLHPESDVLYVGSATYLGNCIDHHNGTTMYKNGYQIKSQVKIKIATLNPDGTASRITGTRVGSFTRRPGVPHGCALHDHNKLEFVGTAN